jgi:hypothetical protein
VDIFAMDNISHPRGTNFLHSPPTHVSEAAYDDIACISVCSMGLSRSIT